MRHLQFDSSGVAIAEAFTRRPDDFVPSDFEPCPAELEGVDYRALRRVDGQIVRDDVCLAEQHASGIRAERDRRLAVSDRYALPDYPHADDAARQAWLDYRQALRDLPEQDGFPWGGADDPAVVWPVEPGGG